MYFVGDNLYTMLLADVVHAFQFLFLPNTSCRIVRVAEDESSRLLVSTFALKILEIDFVSAVSHTFQLVFYYFATAVSDAREEAVVHWSLYQHFLAWHTDCFQTARDGWHYA